MAGDATAPRADAPDRIASLGGWLFKRRSWLPLPLVFALLLIPGTPDTPWSVRYTGVALTLAGEALRFWGVLHIGAVSRTRSDRLGPLIQTGPFGLVRNPLYLGNAALWLGFALTAGLAWLTPVIALLLALEYHPIVRWEERLLAARLGQQYHAYAARVPRWIPRSPTRLEAVPAGTSFSWSATLFSERATLFAIVVAYVLLYLKDRA